MNKIIFFYVTCANIDEANEISKHLIESKLVACCNIFSMNSIYFWNEKINNDNEYVIILKTTSKYIDKVESEIKKIHSYKIPCIAYFEVNVNDEYYEWIQKQLN